jgi:hypothetical protein
MNIQIIVSIIFLIGSIITFWGIIVMKRRRSFLNSAMRTQGTVVQMKRGDASVFVSTNDDQNMAFRQEENMFKGETVTPIIEFNLSSGRKIQIKGSSSTKPKYKIGSPVQLFYATDRPEKAVIDSFFEKWFLSLFLITFGSITMMTAMLVLSLG